MRKVEIELEEGETNGQWKKRRNELELEARRRVPDFQVIIAFSQKTGEDVQVAPEDADATARPSGKVRVAMLAESSTRLLWLYHLCFPSLVAEARFDVGKLLQTLFDHELGAEHNTESISGLDTLRRLHVLRLLRESDQFLWSSKSGKFCSQETYFELTTSARNPLLYQHPPERIRFYRGDGDSGRD